MTKSQKPTNLELFEEMTTQLIAEARRLGLPNARVRDLQETKVVIKQIRKAREKP
jgi:hypothetical protein